MNKKTKFNRKNERKASFMLFTHILPVS